MQLVSFVVTVRRLVEPVPQTPSSHVLADLVNMRMMIRWWQVDEDFPDLVLSHRLNAADSMTGLYKVSPDVLTFSICSRDIESIE